MRKWPARRRGGGPVVGSPRRARADDRRCELDPDTGQLKCVLVAQPSPPLSVRLSVRLPLVWKRAPFNDWEMVARTRLRSTADVTEVGIGYVVTLINTATLDQLYLDYVCEWPGGSRRSRHRLRLGQAEFVQANTQALQIGPSGGPPGSIGGLTGLDSWFWCADPGAVATGVSLRGWTASGAVEVVQLGWEVDGPDGTADTSTSCGSEEAPRSPGRPRRAASIRGHVDGRLGRHLGSHVERHPDGVVPSRSDQPDRSSRRTPSMSIAGS